MKAGDLVRFKYGLESWQWEIGLLVKYEAWEKMGTVLYEGKLIRLRGEYMQKAGRKDESR